MTRVKLTDNFYLDEFIAPEIYSVRGARSVELLDMRIVLACQFIREGIGKSIIVNNWIRGGQYRESGLRSATTRTGAKWSQHKYGRAADIKVAGMSPDEVYLWLKGHEQTMVERQWITTIEDTNHTPTWLHIDCRYTGADKFRIVKP
jgi:hypothetical protein